MTLSLACRRVGRAMRCGPTRHVCISTSRRRSLLFCRRVRRANACRSSLAGSNTEGMIDNDGGIDFLTLRKEEVKVIDLTNNKTKSIERHRDIHNAMHTSHVKSELVVDKEPEIVVCRNVDRLATIVGKAKMSVACVKV